MPIPDYLTDISDNSMMPLTIKRQCIFNNLLTNERVVINDTATKQELIDAVDKSGCESVSNILNVTKKCLYEGGVMLLQSTFNFSARGNQ